MPACLVGKFIASEQEYILNADSFYTSHNNQPPR